MQIVEITEFSQALQNGLAGFMEQLTGRMVDVKVDFLRELIESPHSHLFCAVGDDGTYIGTITVGVYLLLTGMKAWIEDVVVSEQQRGLGIGKAMVQHAIAFVRQKGVESLMLTSNSSRIAANNLYKSLDFEQRATNVYRMILT